MGIYTLLLEYGNLWHSFHKKREQFVRMWQLSTEELIRERTKRRSSDITCCFCVLESMTRNCRSRPNGPACEFSRHIFSKNSRGFRACRTALTKMGLANASIDWSENYANQWIQTDPAIKCQNWQRRRGPPAGNRCYRNMRCRRLRRKNRRNMANFRIWNAWCACYDKCDFRERCQLENNGALPHLERMFRSLRLPGVFPIIGFV